MRGIDISNWQNGLSISNIADEIDFAIMKATGGTSFVDWCCDPWVQECIEHGIPWGFYHFGNDDGYNEPYNEARFFIQNCQNYFGHGIPVLDWECDSIDADWVNTFVNIVHSETGIWPWIYGNAWRFNSNVEQNCGRWVASYPNWYRPNLDKDLPDPPSCDGLICAWQFASDGLLNGYSGNLDFNVFYGDEEAWNKYAGVTFNTVEPEPEKIHVLEDELYRITIVRK